MTIDDVVEAVRASTRLSNRQLWVEGGRVYARNYTTTMKAVGRSAKSVRKHAGFDWNISVPPFNGTCKVCGARILRPNGTEWRGRDKGRDNVAQDITECIVLECGTRKAEPFPKLTSAKRKNRAANASLLVAPSHATTLRDALLKFGEAYVDNQSPWSPTEGANPAADELVRDDDFAFLIAVLCNYQWPANRVWQIPLTLKERLGHLDPRRVVHEREKVERAFREPTPVHRFYNGVPRFVLSAAEKVLRDYSGNAGLIWGDKPTALELQSRLTQFSGIDQKKAAMTVEILARDRKIPIQLLEGSDIAIDVHVRRVLLRTGLAERDERQHLIGVARSLNPKRPGALDLPLWLIGRDWCHATNPLCDGCVIGAYCPRYIERA